MQTLKKQLKPILEELNTIPRINSGGCAIVALHLHQYLQSLDYLSQIIYLYEEQTPRNKSTAALEESPHWCDHAVVQVANKYIDTKGIHKKKDIHRQWGLVLTPVSIGYVKRTIEKKNLWNQRFCRQGNVEKIKALLPYQPTEATV